MSRTGLVVWLGGAAALTACGGLAGLVGGGGHEHPTVAILFVNVPDTMFVGDSAAEYLNLNAADGQAATSDTIVSVSSSDPGILLVDPSHPIVPTPRGFNWVYAKASGLATLTAHTTGVTATKVVRVLGPADVGANDRRLGYALAEQASAAAPYAPDPAYRFSSSGGAITVTRDSTGWYTVRFAGLGRQLGQRDNVQVTAYGTPPGIHCKLLSWPTEGADLLVPVHCHDATGAARDALFTLLVSGARAYDLTTPLGFAERLPATVNLIQDTSQTSFNSVTAHITYGKGAIGVYNFVFPGFETFAGPRSMQATAVNGSADRCRVQNYDLVNDVLQAGCAKGDGTANDGRVSVLWFTRGRLGHRYGYASMNGVVLPNPPADAAFTANSTGGTVTSHRLGVGNWTVTFAGLARPAGATEIVIVSAFKDFDHTCTLLSWASAGADLTVTLQCFDAGGTPFDGRFSVLIVE